MSEVKVNKISPRSGTTVTLGDSGDTITLASGVSLTGVNATFSGNTTIGGNLTVDTNTFFIDSVNNIVRVGDNSSYTPNASADDLIVGNTTSGSKTGITILSSNDVAFSRGSIYFADSAADSIGRIEYNHGTSDTDVMKFFTNTAEAMRIDSSGNVYIGTTNLNPVSANVTGTTIKAQGNIQASRDSGAVISGNRKGTDGDIFELRKNGTTVGSIGSSAGNYLTIGNNVNTRLRFTASDIRPCDSSGADRDNAIDLGDGVVGARFKDLYLGGNIYLGGTGSANALDDYETGAWTPVIEGTSTAGTASYVTRVAKYVKIGKTVTATTYIHYTSGTGTGNLQIGGLPFASENTGNLYHPAVIGYFQSISFNANSTPNAFLGHAGSTKITFRSIPSGGGTQTSISYDSAGEIIITITYITD